MPRFHVHQIVAAGLVGACGDDWVVERVNQVRYFWRGARVDFFDGGDAVLFVARDSALGAIAAKKCWLNFRPQNFSSTGT